MRPTIFSPLVYGRFTEGLDMLDLKEAKALLDELNNGHSSFETAS